jgi:outer membrane protein TolC
MNHANVFRIPIIAGLVMLSAAIQSAAEPQRLTLTEAVRLAISQNRALKIARLKVIENQQKKAGERSAYFPGITNQSNALHITDLQFVEIPAGILGLAAGTAIPPRAIILPQGNLTFESSGTMISQPLTQLIRIHAANQMAAAEVAVSRDDLKKAENQVALQAHALYFGILIARLQKQAAEQQSAYAREHRQ